MESPIGTIFITGANGGLGSALVKRIASSADYTPKYHGFYTVRKVETASALADALASAKPYHKYTKVSLDLSSLAQVRHVAESFNKSVADGSVPRIRALILNAGYQEHAEQSFSSDGFDMSFQCNYLAHFLLTVMLLESMDREHGRIIVIGSSTHDALDPRNKVMGFFKGDEWKEIFHNTESLAKGTSSSAKEYPTMQGGMRRYGAGKLCEVMFMYALQRRLDSDPALCDISVLGVDPGGMPSGLARRGGFLLASMGKAVLPLIVRIALQFFPNGPLRTTQKSAGDVLRAAFDVSTLGEQPKAVYLDGTNPFESSAEARDEKKQDMLWRDSVGYVGLQPTQTVLVNWK
ncbi:NAD(P)-binding protein [Plenodomus tracheiphilus IPT5]|uniref:NAD(P)-binding protein n=1 Tax=Plenodomus tracheiphilus IPT5 TaxID=1408161 RepID=A0A6A7BES4_9PLEO|nr:NAD(P)-binding protein [Plenodomus tracheiphilus IPT5]